MITQRGFLLRCLNALLRFSVEWADYNKLDLAGKCSFDLIDMVSAIYRGCWGSMPFAERERSA